MLYFFLIPYLLPIETWIDWVSLDVNGVVRGDLYLEMTYYANAPTPAAAPKNKILAPPYGSALDRRPSKLSPSDRLSRPFQQHAAGPSRFPPQQLSQLSNPTSSHTSAAPTTQNQRSPSLPQAIQSQPALVPSILRPGGPSPPDVSLSPTNPYIRSNGAYTPVHSGLSNIDGTLSNPYTTSSDTYIAEQRHQQASGGRAYSPAPPGAFIPGNRPAPDRRSYSHSQASRVTSPNPYIDSGTFLPGGQQQQASAERTYSPLPPTLSMQVSGPSHPSVPITVSPSNPYIGYGGVYLPEDQLRPNVTSYSPAPTSPPVQTSRPPSIDHSAPTNLHAGGRAAFVPGSQQAPDGLAYSSSPPIDTVQTLGYANHITSLQANSPSFPYNASTGPSSNSVPPVQTSRSLSIDHSAPTNPYTGGRHVTSPQANVPPPGMGPSSSAPSPLAFPTPMIPILMEPYGYHEPSSHYQPPLPRSRTISISNNRISEQEELDPHFLARYQTPLPLPAKESPLPPRPPLPPIVTPGPLQVSSSPPVLVTPAAAPSSVRIEALRRAEQDAALRKEQELNDLELAMRLDRELNL